MNTQDFKRKLTAVFSADVAGYSRLMGEDEAATVKTLESYKQILFSLIRQHRGRVIDSPGDNVLAEFASVVDAVQCGVAVQNELKMRNVDLPENRRMQFRIGINLGDIIEEGERIYGDGVNIAARLEALADPGGICVSKTAFDHIEAKLPLGYHFLGEQTVKNIAKPVGAYKVLMEPRVTGAEKKVKAQSVPVWRRKSVLAGAVAVLVVIIGLAVWNFYMRAPKFEPASKGKMALPLPDKPSIAVLPFANMSGDPKQEYLSDGITESIITAVSKIHNLFVIARNSTFAYKGKAVKIQQVARELGVQYVLEGSVQRSGDRLRITAQLIDALSRSHIWAQKYDRELKDLFAVQDDSTMEILQAMRVKLSEGQQVLRANRPKNIESAMKFYEAKGYGLLFTPEANDMSRKLAEEVIAMDPDWGEGYYILSEAHMMDVFLGTTKSPKESIDKAIELAQKAISQDESLAQALALIGYLYGMKREWDKSVAYAEKAVEKDPNGADAHAWLGNCLRWAARPQEAIPHYEMAMRLNPYPPQWYYLNLGGTYTQLGRYEESLAQIKKAIALSPRSATARVWLIVLYGAMGKENEARATAAELLKIDPKFSAERILKAMPYKDDAFLKLAAESFRKAGLLD